MIKSLRINFKALLLLIILIALALVTSFMIVEQFNLNQISNAFVKTLESKDIGFLQTFISDQCQIVLDSKSAAFKHANKEISDTVIFNEEHRYEQIKFLGTDHNKQYSRMLLYHVTAINEISDEIPKDNLLSYCIIVELDGMSYKITSIQVET